jgi:hypothetical protein
VGVGVGSSTVLLGEVGKGIGVGTGAGVGGVGVGAGVGGVGVGAGVGGVGVGAGVCEATDPGVKLCSCGCTIHECEKLGVITESLWVCTCKPHAGKLVQPLFPLMARLAGQQTI